MASNPVLLSGWNFRQLTLEGLAEWAGSSVGATGLDLWPWNHAGLTEEEVVASCMRYNCPPVVLNVSTDHRFGDEGAWPQVVREVQESIRLASSVHAAYVQVYLRHLEPGADGDRSVELISTWLRRCLPAAEAAGICLVVENNFDRRHEDLYQRNITRQPDLLSLLCEQVASPNFGITFDLCNFYMTVPDQYERAWDVLREHVRVVHVKNVTRPTPPGLANLRVPLVFADSLTGSYVNVPRAYGDIDFGRHLSRFLRDGFQGPIVIDPLASVEDAPAITYDIAQLLIEILATDSELATTGDGHATR